MLDIYSDTIVLTRDAGLAARVIAKYDADLARQLRRAATSVPLNVAEGSGVHGGNRRQRYATALGSAREVMACFDVAVAMEYLPRLGDGARDRLDKVIATLVKVSR
jgi:four helix bundle protein